MGSTFNTFLYLKLRAQKYGESHDVIKIQNGGAQQIEVTLHQTVFLEI